MSDKDGASPTHSSTTTRARDSKEPAPHHVTGQLDIFTEHVNAHIRYYRMLPWLVGSMGVVLFLRFTHIPLRRFRQVSDIPGEFYVMGKGRLSGVVMATGWNTIGVWHVPTWRWVLRWRTRPPSEWCLKFMKKII